MNLREREMVTILRELVLKGSVLSVKAEFEAEGTRMDELMRLVDIAKSSGCGLTVKIGGCEAKRDLLESKQIGVNVIVAPMVETPYATQKYGSAVESVFDSEERKDMLFLVNTETSLSLQNLDAILDEQKKANLSGIVFGRVDFVGSLQLARDKVNSNQILDKVVEAARMAKSQEKMIVVGGGVSIESLGFLKEVKKVHLDRFETRKVVFNSSALDAKEIEQDLLRAVKFELLWLLNKQDYYGRISREDQQRIEMLESRWKVL